MSLWISLIAIGEATLRGLSRVELDERTEFIRDWIGSAAELDAWDAAHPTSPCLFDDFAPGRVLPPVAVGSDCRCLTQFLNCSREVLGTGRDDRLCLLYGNEPLTPNDYCLWAHEVRAVADGLSDFRLDELVDRACEAGETMLTAYAEVVALSSPIPDAILAIGDFDPLIDKTRLLTSYYRLAAEQGSAMIALWS